MVIARGDRLTTTSSFVDVDTALPFSA